MTLYICQCPHRLDAKVWTARDEAEVIAAIVGNGDDTFDSALDAASYDMRDAYVTDDPLDLWLWIEGNEAPNAARAQRAFFRDYTIVADIEEIATRDDSGEDTVYTAFDGRFTWCENEGEWRLGNQPPVEADDLAHALTAASLRLAFGSKGELSDV